MDMNLDAFFMYAEAAQRIQGRHRAAVVQDTGMAIAGAFAKDRKPIEDYIKLLEGTT